MTSNKVKCIQSPFFFELVMTSRKRNASKVSCGVFFCVRFFPISMAVFLKLMIPPGEALVEWLRLNFDPGWIKDHQQRSFFRDLSRGHLEWL